VNIADDLGAVDALEIDAGDAKASLIKPQQHTNQNPQADLGRSQRRQGTAAGTSLRISRPVA
jgi:hypothetical protein